MLALPGIPALPGGVESPQHTSPPRKSGTDGDNKFLKMLTILGSEKVDIESVTESGKQSGKQSKGVKQPNKDIQGNNAKAGVPSLAILTQASSGILAKTKENTIAKAETQGLAPRDDQLGPGAKKSRNDNENNAGLAMAQTNAPRCLGLPASMSLASSTLNVKNAQHVSGMGKQGNLEDNSKLRTKGINKSGIETLGSSTESAEGGKKIRVVDMRLKARTELAERQTIDRKLSQGSGNAAEGSGEAIKHEASVARNHVDGSGFSANVGSRLEGAIDNPSLQAKDGAQPQSMSENLASRLRDGAADIVRSAQIVLRDGDSGLIRLRLEPESLGGVKIELKMTEKQISGRIVVQSDIAGEAFRSSLDALKDAFAECGFETTALEVEVRNGLATGSEGNGGDHAGEERDEPYWSRSLRELDAAVPMVATAGRDGLLNVFV